MQFFLDENAVPISLFASNNAPRRHQEPPRQQGHPLRFPSQQQHREQRSVPGYPYIRFIEDDDLDGGYPFDAFQDLRSAYFASPLSDIQSRMRNLQHQRAQSQLRRSLLEQQLREHEQRERELLEYQQRLEHERRAHAKAAADRARASYLSRLEKEEQQRQLDALCAARHAASEKASAQRNMLAVDESDDERAVFYPPFHFFNHILNNQIRSQDDIERKRAEKNALNNLLEAYFGQAASGGEQKENAAAVSRESSAGVKQGSRPPTKLNMSGSESSLDAQPVSMATSSTNVAGNQSPSLSTAVDAAPAKQLPPFGIRSSQLDSGVLDNVLRVVHDRLAEIAAAEESEKQKSTSASGPSAENSSSDIDVNVVDEEEEEEPSRNEKANPNDSEPTVDETQKGVEVEEPTDYGKLADTLRRRVGDLNDDNMFLPLSPLLASHDDEDSDSESQPTLAHKPQKQHSTAIDPVTITMTDNDDDDNRHMDVECDDAEHSDKEFADMLSNCKNQLKDLTEATTKHDSEAAHRRRRRRRQNHRSRSRRHRNYHHQQQQQQQVESTTAASDAAEPPSTQKIPVTVEASKPEETEEQRQKRAVTTIEDYILGARKARKAKEVRESLDRLGKIDQELAKIREDYNWRLRNMQLSFVADKNGNLKLAYNRGNRAFHEYQEVLQRLLLNLDEVQSYGDESVRFKRKTIVKKIQNTLDALDQFAADQESELSESSGFDVGTLADESSNGELVY
ncbi:hypothetical protein LPJ57_005752 [Coemansia sp. RSA 486]|nr:hypothetical protein LPJ57_005752 [Coemansia sp. RSA 486]KAJ2231520.1 hypothetical protein IWW45_005450 [Coemansia sp. RSA 485]